jgi:hypothetical protein
LYLRGFVNTGTGISGAQALTERRGNGNVGIGTTTIAGGTNVQVTAGTGGVVIYWTSGPITTPSVTVAGDITINLRGLESAATVNAGFAVLIERTDDAGSVLSTVVPLQAVGAELGLSQSVRTLTVTPTSTNFSFNERIKVTVSYTNAGGTMGAGTATVNVNGAASGAGGDSFITLTEDIVTGVVQDVSPFEIKGSNAYYG